MLSQTRLKSSYVGHHGGEHLAGIAIVGPQDDVVEMCRDSNFLSTEFLAWINSNKNRASEDPNIAIRGNLSLAAPSSWGHWQLKLYNQLSISECTGTVASPAPVPTYNSTYLKALRLAELPDKLSAARQTWFPSLLTVVRTLFQTPAALRLENLALRHQL